MYWLYKIIISRCRRLADDDDDVDDDDDDDGDEDSRIRPLNRPQLSNPKPHMETKTCVR